MSARVLNPLEKVSLAVQMERDAVTYFDRAHKLVDDPRVREAFGKLANEKREQLQSFEDGINKLKIALPQVPKDAQVKSAYPVSEVQKAECYVCGHSVEVTAIPNSCPRCGASVHAFQKMVEIQRVWEIAERGSYTILKLLNEAEKGADEGLRKVLAMQTQIEQKMLERARKELERRGSR